MRNQKLWKQIDDMRGRSELTRITAKMLLPSLPMDDHPWNAKPAKGGAIELRMDTPVSTYKVTVLVT